MPGRGRASRLGAGGAERAKSGPNKEVLGQAEREGRAEDKAVASERAWAETAAEWRAEAEGRGP